MHLQTHTHAHAQQQPRASPIDAILLHFNRLHPFAKSTFLTFNNFTLARQSPQSDTQRTCHLLPQVRKAKKFHINEQQSLYLDNIAEPSARPQHSRSSLLVGHCPRVLLPPGCFFCGNHARPRQPPPPGYFCGIESRHARAFWAFPLSPSSALVSEWVREGVSASESCERASEWVSEW